MCLSFTSFDGVGRVLGWVLWSVVKLEMCRDTMSGVGRVLSWVLWSVVKLEMCRDMMSAVQCFSLCAI